MDALIGETLTTEQLEVLFRQMKKRIVERMLEGELTHHLGYARARTNPPSKPSIEWARRPRRCSPMMEHCRLRARDRAGTFKPQVVPKGVRRLPGFDTKVLSPYARGLTTATPRAAARWFPSSDKGLAVLAALPYPIRSTTGS
jgi:putative transposase